MRGPASVSSGIAIAALVAAALVGCSEQPAPEPPKETTLAMPASPITDRFLNCIRDEGWEAERSWSGGIEGPEMPTAQLNQWQAVADQCAIESGWSEGFLSLTDAQLKQLYEQEVAEYECLKALGHEPEPPPTYQAYMDTFKSADQYYAFASVLDGVGGSAFNAIVAQCPPPTWFLNLDGL